MAHLPPLSAHLFRDSHFAHLVVHCTDISRSEIVSHTVWHDEIRSHDMIEIVWEDVRKR